MNKPYSEACEENRAPILAVLREHLPRQGRLLEIGSGTGQHAVYFAGEFPELIWQTSDRLENHAGINAWLSEAPHLSNLRAPLALDVSVDPWPAGPWDAMFSANTCHIMTEADVRQLFTGVGQALASGGRFLLYGPFNIHGQYTAQSNANFDAMLRARGQGMGVRDREWLIELADAAGLDMQATIDMPADNKILHWLKR